MSRSAEDRDGFVVITEVSPKTNQGEPSQTGQTAVPASNKHLQKFFKGEPKALGVSQILNGITQICFGIVCDMGSETFRRYEVPLFLTGVPYWSGLLYIVSGSLSVAAADKPRISLVRGTLVMNTVSAVFSGIAVIIYIIYVCVWDYAGGNRYRSCYYYDRQEESAESDTCRRLFQVINIFWAMLFLLLILTVLELCVSISVAVFGCKTLCRTAYSEVSVVIYQTTSPNVVHPPHPDMNVDLPSRPAISETLPP